MWETIKSILSSIGGTLFLFFIGTLSFCIAMRIFIMQSLTGTKDTRLTYLALLLVILTTLITRKLISPNQKEIHDYAKEEGFDENSRTRTDEDSDMELSEGEELTDLSLIDDEDENIEDEDEEEADSEYEMDEDDTDEENSSQSSFDVSLDFDDSDSLQKFGEDSDE
jgi:hypothetical protein